VKKNSDLILFKFINALFFGLLSTSFTLAFAGGSSGGGPGTGVINEDGTATLLPIYIANSSYRDTFLTESVNLPDRTACLFFPAHNFKFKYDSCPTPKAVELPGQFALERLEKWKCSSPTLIKALRQGLLATHFYFVKDDTNTSRSKPIKQGYFLPKELRGKFDLELKTIAYYDRDTVVRVNVDIYNRLGDASRAGLFLWEALREVILANRGNINIEQQQNLLAKIVLSSPQENETLETSDYMGGQLLNLALQNRQKINLNCEPSEPFPMDFRFKLEQSRIRELEKELGR
jgi:hypothetical protein